MAAEWLRTALPHVERWRASTGQEADVFAERLRAELEAARADIEGLATKRAASGHGGSLADAVIARSSTWTEAEKEVIRRVCAAQAPPQPSSDQ